MIETCLDFHHVDNTELEKVLIDSLRRISVTVRVERVEDSSGGFCRLDDHPLVVLSPDALRSRRIEILLHALRQLDTSGIYLPPAVRDLIDRENREYYFGKIVVSNFRNVWNKQMVRRDVSRLFEYPQLEKLSEMNG